MAYITNENSETIICDKCSREQTASSPKAGKEFFSKGWVANFRAKKYVHLCYDCQTKKGQKLTKWTMASFPV